MTHVMSSQDPVSVPVDSDQLVFDVLRTANGPVSAYDILDLPVPARPASPLRRPIARWSL